MSVALGAAVSWWLSGCYIANCPEVVDAWTPATYTIANAVLPELDGGTVELTDDGHMVIRYLDATGVATTVTYSE
ncbi:MAG: hypothetical protein KC621_34800 [Myxococcales bacterium]|nr:hypothetical protein [Myxococcales bacterium]